MPKIAKNDAKTKPKLEPKSRKNDFKIDASKVMQKKVSKNIDFLMAWTLLIEAGACTRARFSTFQPAAKNHQKSIPKSSNFGTQTDEKSTKNRMPKSDRKNNAKSDAKRNPKDPHLEAPNQKAAKVPGQKMVS